jgi:SAM-dependent methyltransferase
MSDIAYYFDKIADEFNGYYAGRRPSLIQEIGYRVFRGPGLRKRFADTVGILGECSGAEILDIGCGPGIYAQYFAKKGANMTAIDISKNMVELARGNLSQAGIKNFDIINGDFLAHDFKKEFDYTLAIGLFDYISKYKRDAYFDKLTKITRKSIVATFPKMFVFQMPVRKALFILKNQPVYFYTKGMIIKMADRHGLRPHFHDSGPIWTIEFTIQ